MTDYTEWLARYKVAWETKDAHAAAALFTEDGIYRAHPLRDPHIGREAIERYWSEGSGTQEDIKMAIRKPVLVDGQRVAAEWHASLVYEGAPNTLIGGLFLEFAASGLCKELREYYFLEGAEADGPPAAWT